MLRSWFFASSRSYIKQFVWYKSYDSIWQSIFRFSLCLHYHTSCSYWVHQSCSSRVQAKWFKKKLLQQWLITALNSKKSKSRGKRQKGRICVIPWLKRRKSFGFYETLLEELRLEDEYNYKTLFKNDFWKYFSD